MTGWVPLELTHAELGSELVDFLDDTGHVDKLLLDNKGIVFRGFGLGPDALEPVLDRLVPGRLAYVHGNSPRTKVGKNVYTSTEYPPEFTISMHNELSYAHSWPTRLLFFCERAPETEGATTVVDCHAWLASLDTSVREAFREGVRYTQNLHSGLGFGKSWQDTFETEDRAAVEELLDGTGASWEWNAAGGLRTSYVRPATIRHPVTGQEVWFNQADQWHTATLDADTADALVSIMEEDELPQSVTFADGSPIPDEYVVHVRDQGLDLAVDVAWRSGDLMVIDNVALAHGRRSFTGPRRVLVAMSH